MADLAVTLLPAGVARAGIARPGSAVRLVLTGPGGGTWDVGLDGAAVAPGAASARITVATDAFCRAVGNRVAPGETHAWIDGDEAVAADLFADAAALALD